MKIHKYLISPLLYLVLYACAFIIHPLVKWLVSELYFWLTMTFPSLFHRYNEITDPEGFASYSQAMTLVCALATIYIINRLLFTLDNKRFEFMITATDGMYTLRDGYRIYFREFLVTDMIYTALIPLIALGICPFLSAEALEYGAWMPLCISFEMYDSFGIPLAALHLTLISVIARILSAMSAVKGYRAMWLTGSV